MKHRDLIDGDGSHNKYCYASIEMTFGIGTRNHQLGDSGGIALPDVQ
jgi:hypothetical protein